MRRYSHYDEPRGVIHTDASGLTQATRVEIDALFDELVALADSLPAPVWVVACWRDASFVDFATAEHYGERTAELLKHVKGVVRYAANDPLTRSVVRAQMLKHREAGTRANFYETFEEALAATRELGRTG